ncbi:sigma 54-interacting transcriptional regulator [Desulfitobacterium sp.]|uniref:sigma 54-interacting transcriptional regulator n=1 Tax=Desulfitobacterium sp. TaxID=49981 RepID=UPI002B59065F|nr:sigma 54-interacting transcriptional regulator [Desulfitobacterium sp.]HVJ50418.1 sigma 54-interacting transcriptional regulator [Desulfitobacterium sp.]
MDLKESENKITIGIVAPYLSFKESATKISRQIENVNFEIFEGMLEETEKLIPKFYEKKIDVVLSRAGTANYLQGRIDLPVVSCEITFYDLAVALKKVKRFGKKIAVILFGSKELDIPLLEEIFAIQIIHKHSYKDKDSIMIAIKESIEEGCEVIVGSSFAVEYALEMGIPGLTVESRENSLKDALKEAENIARVRRREQERIEEMKVMLDFAYSGVISVTAEGKIQMFNKTAKRIMSVTEDPIGKYIESVVPNSHLKEVVETGQRQIGEIQQLKTTSIITSRVPVILKGEIIGAVATFHEAGNIQRWEQKLRREASGKGLIAKKTFENIKGSHPAMRDAVEKARHYAKSDLPILIYGETGTGKEVFAQSIHNGSPKTSGPFVAINCSALPESLLESELFGYEEGAFTGAKKGGKPGVFELAHGGTLFLDEIGSISKALQPRLLRVLQEKEVMRLGSDRIVPVDFRLITATNVNLTDTVKSGDFRSDLYFRIHVLNLRLPTLRDHKEDIAELAVFFLRHEGVEKSLITKEFEQKLRAYDWPGNIRELESFCRRLSILESTMTAFEVFGEYLDEMKEEPVKVTRKTDISIDIAPWEEMERDIFRQVVNQFDGNRTLAAEALGISRSTIWKKLR